VEFPLSDDEDGKWDNVGECPHCRHRGITGTRCPLCEGTGFIHESAGVRQIWCERLRTAARTQQERLTANILRIVRVGRAGNELPGVGQTCLVVKGEEQKDLGQECVVSKVTASRVHVSFLDGNGWQATKLKHPSSLILLEEGLHVPQDARGCIWIK
jgi:hypothetical protein